MEKEFNISGDVPSFCYELQCELQTVKEHLVAQPEHNKYVKIA